MDLGHLEQLVKLNEMLKAIESPQEKIEAAQVRNPNVEEVMITSQGEQDG